MIASDEYENGKSLFGWLERVISPIVRVITYPYKYFDRVRKVKFARIYFRRGYNLNVSVC